jgi:hypothetical protein
VVDCLTHLPPREGRAPRRADDGYLTCSDCCSRLHRWLSPVAFDDDGQPDGIPGLYATLNPRPGSGGNNGGIRTPGFGPRSPANDHILSMRDARTTQVVPSDPAAAPAVLREWVLYVWDERYDSDALNRPDYRERRAALPTEVEPAAAWLDQQLDWLTRRDIIADLFGELRTLHSRLRSIGDRRRSVGACPNMVGEAGARRRCEAKLFAPWRGDVIRCWQCHREWPREDWLRLADLQDSL